MGSPRVSVVLAVHNGEPYLETALSSIVRQSLRDFELIVVNDGSIDRSRDIVERMRDSRIRLLDNERNLGLTPSLNRGLAIARGEYIARLDADDIAAPDRLERQVAFLDAHRDVALLGAWYRTIDEGGRWHGRARPPNDHVALRWALLFHCPFAHSSVAWRREAVAIAAGEYDAHYSYAMDWEFWSRIASRLRVASLPRVLAFYRVQPRAMTATDPRVALETRMARDAALQFTLGADATQWRALDRMLYALEDGWDHRAGAEEIALTVDSIRLLSDAFSDRLALNRDARRTHAEHVRRWLGRQLMAHAASAHDLGRSAQGQALYRAAVETFPGVRFTAKCGRYVLARLSLHKRRA